ncbi:MAG: NAC domain-containing protein, partial [Candidatus Bathyarchaeia archaeon]
MSFRRPPGFKGVPTGRDAVRLMQKMGMNLEELPGVLEVQIKTGDKTIVVENPAVTVIKMQGQSIFQVSGGAVKEITM